jgi:hypothetical protein
LFATAANWLLDDLGRIFAAELVIAVLIAAGALLVPHLEARWFIRFRRALRPIAWNPRLQLIVVGVLSILLRALFLPIVGPPEPAHHDEHSLMLLGQTLAAGRMTNEPHPHWQHFESFHINQQPTYSSSYFAGRGFPAALGFVLGHPWIGVWISVVAMCVATCWMLQAWVSLPWAFVGALIIILRYAVFSYWANSYWGGALTAAGAALVLGALPRIQKLARARDGAWLGFGIFLLLTTRPYEGLLLCLPVAGALLVWMARRPGLGPTLKVLVPGSLLAAAGPALLLYHSWRVTGEPLLTPYDVNRRMYALAPAFLLAPPYPKPEYRSRRIQAFYEWEYGAYSRKYSAKGLLTILLARVRLIWNFYIGPLLTIPFVVAAVALSDPRVRFLVLTLLIFFAGYLIETWGFAHYASPITPAFIALVAIGLERLRTTSWRRGLPGRFVSTAVPLSCALLMLLPSSTALFGWPNLDDPGSSWCCTFASSGSHRAQVRGRLEQLPGRDLVLVRYSDDYTIHDEWVYNDARIDSASIVWAHDLGDQANRALLDYYSDRKVWLLFLQWGARPELTPYQAGLAK